MYTLRLCRYRHLRFMHLVHRSCQYTEPIVARQVFDPLGKKPVMRWFPLADIKLAGLTRLFLTDHVSVDDIDARRLKVLSDDKVIARFSIDTAMRYVCVGPEMDESDDVIMIRKSDLFTTKMDLVVRERHYGSRIDDCNGAESIKFKAPCRVRIASDKMRYDLGQDKDLCETLSKFAQDPVELLSECEVIAEDNISSISDLGLNPKMFFDRRYLSETIRTSEFLVG